MGQGALDDCVYPAVQMAQIRQIDHHSAAPGVTSVLVRSPASRWRHCRSMPISAQQTSANTGSTTTGRRLFPPVPSCAMVSPCLPSNMNSTPP